MSTSPSLPTRPEHIRAWLNAARDPKQHGVQQQANISNEMIMRYAKGKPAANLVQDTLNLAKNSLSLPANPELRHALMEAGRNGWISASQDSAALKQNVAFLATIVHVVMRAREAYVSSNAPTQTKEEAQYNQEQSAMTYYREFVGVALGWGLLKKVGASLSKHITEKSGYVHKGFGNRDIGDAIGDVVGLLQGRKTAKDIIHMPNAVTAETEWHRQTDAPINRAYAQFGHAFEKHADTNFVLSPELFKRASNMVTGKDVDALIQEAQDAATSPDRITAIKEQLLAYELKGFKFTRSFLPPAIAAVPSIIISGWFVEYSSLHYSKSVKKYMLGLMEFLHVIPKPKELVQHNQDAGQYYDNDPLKHLHKSIH